MKLRNNLSGRMKFQSFIPPRISEYTIEADSGRLQELETLFGELAELLEALPEDEIKELIAMEAEDSWRLADERPRNPFSFDSGEQSVNAANIARATLYGAEALQELPISTRLIRNIHYLICEGPDYDKKYRGEYRKSPVWIGAADTGLTGAAFVAPIGEDMDAAITDLENYINYSDENQFVKAAVIHYQFEMIHPFIDGNGRTGRLLNTLYLMESGKLPAPALLLSHIISRNYNRYCEELQHVNETSDISTWVAFWLQTMTESAKYTRRLLNFRLSNSSAE